MSYKFDSLILILNKIDRNELVTIESLMSDLDVSERTVYRYLETLQKADFPIEYDSAKECYVFREGYSLKKPDLSVEEKLSFALAKRFLAGFGDSLEQSLASIEDKLTKRPSIVPEHIYMAANPLSSGVESCLRAILEATQNYQRIELFYKALYNNEETKRKVDPYYLFFADGFWNLRAYCYLREDFRTFALDRIFSMKVLREYFIPDRISPDKELSHGLGVITEGEPEAVSIKFAKEVVPYVIRKKWHYSQTEAELKDGGLEMRFNIPINEETKKWIYQWIPYVEAISPQRLQTEVLDDLKSEIKKLK